MILFLSVSPYMREKARSLIKMNERKRRRKCIFLLPSIFQNGSTAFHEVTKIKKRKFNSIFSLLCAYLVSFWRHHHMKLSISVLTTIFICMWVGESRRLIYFYLLPINWIVAIQYFLSEIIIFKYFLFIVMTIHRSALNDALNKKR